MELAIAVKVPLYAFMTIKQARLKFGTFSQLLCGLDLENIS